jgi:hypothetical protein
VENEPTGGDWIDALIRRERLPPRYRETIDTVLRPLAARMTIGSSDVPERLMVKPA